MGITYRSSVLNSVCDLLGDELLDAVIKLRGEAHARTVDLSQNESVALVLIPVEDEVGAPNERSGEVAKFLLDLGESQVEVLHENGPLIGFVISVFGSREEGC